MTKKETVKKEIPTLLTEEYWKWRFLISELEKAKVACSRADIEIRLMQKELEQKSTALQLFKATEIRKNKEELSVCEKEYFAFKKEIEARLGVSLNNKMIDDVTFEVREIPKDNTHIG